MYIYGFLPVAIVAVVVVVVVVVVAVVVVVTVVFVVDCGGIVIEVIFFWSSGTPRISGIIDN